MTIGILACQLTFPRPGQRIPAILTATLTGGIATGVLGVTLIERGESNVKKVFAAGLIVLGVTLTAVAASAEPNFTAGQWEVKGEMKLDSR